MGRTKCEVCKKKCAGDILKADDKYFHIACFNCHTCRRPLSEVGYFERSGQYYCPSDYQATFGVKCPACGQYAEGNVVQCAEWTYHQRCFKCTRCGKPFPNGEKVTFSNANEHLCQRCVSVPVAMVRPTQQPPQPQQPPAPSADQVDAHQHVKEIDVKLEQQVQQKAAPAPPPQQQHGGPPVCAACEQIIHSGQVLLALDAQWHIWCFKCTTCDSVLHGEYMAKDGHPYCIRDYNALYGVRCYECDKYIAGRVLQAGQYQFHPACARCARCAESFADGEEMYMQDSFSSLSPMATNGASALAPFRHYR